MNKREIIRLESVDSTNNYAAALLQGRDVPDGTVVWAGAQTAGRGQHENRWESEPGMNLTFSLIIRPKNLSPERQFLINKAIALGTLDYLRLHLPDAAIKWPNDILAGFRKIAGILIEHRIMGGTIQATIAGIGINVNQKEFHPGIPNPGSLKQFLHRELPLQEELLLLLEKLECRRGMLTPEWEHRLHHDYDAALLFSGTSALFREGEQEFRGTIAGVDYLGRLLILTETGESRSYLHREVEYVIPPQA